MEITRESLVQRQAYLFDELKKKAVELEQIRGAYVECSNMIAGLDVKQEPDKG